MGKLWQEWKKEKQRLEKERKAKRKKVWVSPEQYFGEDHYKNIIFFTQGREALARYEAEQKLKEFEQKIRESEVIND